MENEKQRTDHKGTVYSSRAEMLKVYGIKTTTFKTRLKFGWSLEKALTTPVKKYEPITDHKGIVYESEKAMANAYGLHVSALRTRLKNGWSLKDALTKDTRQNIDHLGNKYKSLDDMLKHYNILESTYHTRLTRGWSLEKALTTPIAVTSCGIKTKDPFGNEYVSTKEIAAHYNIDYDKWHHMQRNGYTTAEIIGIIPLLKSTIKNEKINDNLLILESIKDEETNIFYFHCIYNNDDTVYSRNELLEKCKKELHLASL